MHYVVQSENFDIIASFILTEVNYDIWSQIKEMQIARREKLEYIMEKNIHSAGYWCILCKVAC